MPRITGVLVVLICFAFLKTQAFESEHGHDHGDYEESIDELSSLWSIEALACKAATASQLTVVNKGNTKTNRFINQCLAATNNSAWCQQVIRPNPSSLSTFRCTYGPNQVHRLIHPDESTWPNAIKAVQFVSRLEAMGIKVAQIYNWWRPEPYNGNVGGAAGRHPFGTSVDVRFQTLNDMEKAHTQLCKWRKAGQIRAVGYYGSTGLHIGVGDKTANTWGKDCP